MVGSLDHTYAQDKLAWHGLSVTPLRTTPSVQELITNFRSNNELKLDMYRENLVHTSLESSLQELSSDTWFSTAVSESSGRKKPEKGSNDIE